MYCRVIACDFDGTVATDGHLAPEAAAALARARSQGIATILVTGRVLEDVRARYSDWTIFDAIVAENGAVIWVPHDDRTLQLGAPPSERLLTELRSYGVPFHVGAVVVGTWDRHIGEVSDVVRRVGVDAQLIFNRSALMLLPSGINKATGVSRVLEKLCRSAHNLIAVGDAENDFPLLAVAELAVAAGGALSAVVAAADHALSPSGGASVARYLHEVLDAGGVVPTPARHRLHLGQSVEGAPVSIPAAGINVMISGDPRSGKSWLAGRVAEALLDQGYQLCIIDPEGDYVSLGERPHVLAFGHHLALPNPAALPELLRESSRSIVLNLAGLTANDQGVFVREALSELVGWRARSGLPHWIMLDEAQHFLREVTPSCEDLGSASGNFLLVTYRPSLIAAPVYDLVRAHLITRTAVEEERYFITSMLRTRGPQDLIVADAMAGLQLPQAGLLLQTSAGWRWEVFTPSQRETIHAHHARKYFDTQLPESRAFHFSQTGEPRAVVAHSVNEFHSVLQSLPAMSWRHHLACGDFSRWAADVLGDASLAASFRRLERNAAAGEIVHRAELLACIEGEYEISG